MPENAQAPLKINGTQLAHDNFISLITYSDPSISTENIQLSPPVAITEDSGMNTHLTAKTINAGNIKNYLFKYRRPKPLKELPQESHYLIELDRETNSQSFLFNINDLNVVKDDVEYHFICNPTTDGGTPVTNIFRTISELESGFNNDFRYYHELHLVAKDNSLVYQGRSVVKLAKSEKFIQLGAFKSPSEPLDAGEMEVKINNEMTAVDNLIQLANKGGYFRNGVAESSFRSIDQVTDIPHSESTGGYNTSGKITRVLNNGMTVVDDVVWSRLDLSELGIENKIVIPQDEIDSGYPGIYDFINKHLASILTENTQTYQLMNDEDGTEFTILNVNSVEDLKREISTNQSITIKAKQNSLVYKGQLQIIVTTETNEKLLNGFDHADTTENHISTPKTKTLATGILAVEHSGDININTVTVNCPEDKAGTYTIIGEVPSLSMTANGGTVEIKPGLRTYVIDLSLWSGGADCVIALGKNISNSEGAEWTYQFNTETESKYSVDFQ